MKKLQLAGKNVQFIWAPSHCNILGNEKADEFATSGCFKERVDYKLPNSLWSLSTKLRASLNRQYTEYYNHALLTSASIQKYEQVTKGSYSHYISKGLLTRGHQTSYSRIRLGYRYLWEITGDRNQTIKKCRICQAPDGHRLYHYLMECNIVLRTHPIPSQQTYDERIQFLLRPEVFLEIKRLYPNFATSY